MPRGGMMVGLRANNRSMRQSFAKIKKIIDIPNLIEIQKRSYERFLQKTVHPDEREEIGLQAVFKSVFPIKDFNETSSLEFIRYVLGEEKYDKDECIPKGLTYAAALKITVRLVSWDVDPDTGNRSIRDVKEQEVYFGEIPLMTDKGTFIINGTERVIVSQLHRSPGIFFDRDEGKTDPAGRQLYTSRIIPLRGSWIDLEFDSKGITYVRIDRRRKIPATVLLKAMGYSTQEILDAFYKKERIIVRDGQFYQEVDPQLLLDTRASFNITDPNTGELIVRKKAKITRARIRKILDAKIKLIPITSEDLCPKFTAHDIVDPATAEVILENNQLFTKEKIQEILDKKIESFYTLFIDDRNNSTSLRDTLAIDKITEESNKQIDEFRKTHPEVETSNEVYNAQVEIYRRLRPSNPPTIEIATNFFNNLFFKSEYYDLSQVGRLKLNYKLGISSEEAPLSLRTLRPKDLVAAIRYLVELKDGYAEREVDDIDHLGNRRVRAVGELIENQFRIGLVRMERAIKERMSLQEIETLMPNDLINSKPVSAVIKEFFGSSQLSQFMDQTNPLSEVTHKRRLSALGPGGLTRERAGFEVRDVHPTHYGRICPIETPEGPNIGLIVSLSTYARVNDFGFIETPYREVENGVVTNTIRFLTAMEEEEHIIAQANAPLDQSGRFLRELVTVRRKGGEFTMVKAEEVDLMDVSPNQLVSVAASLIPFLEHDDANRALMGSNMQRQAVPLMSTEAPLIGTGMEEVVAKDSGVTVIARRDGIVDSVDASRIVIKATDNFSPMDAGVDIYNLIKYQRSNQNTSINQKPIVKKGQLVRAEDIIADGPATHQGELALGRNVTVAFMPWGGYNFEDSILISERVVQEDRFTSIHIEEFECMARDTKLGKEEITRDIPNIGDESLRNLDESGIIRIGAEVKPQDILVGKITPKGETQLSPEEKLLRAIFGEKAGDVRDTSLRVPPGVEGTVIGAKVFSRRGSDKDERTRAIENEEINKLFKDREDEIRIVQESIKERIRNLLVGRVSDADIMDKKGREKALAKDETITAKILEQIPTDKWKSIVLRDEKDIEEEIRRAFDQLTYRIEMIKVVFNDKINRLKKGDELPPGVIKMVKVYVAIKRRLSVGDKMAGRHGNKGVLSRILPAEDMPYFEDGTPVEIVLNPLSVPSRMNIGQVLETHLGWASKGMGELLGHLIQRNYSSDALRSKIKELLPSSTFAEYIEELEDQGVMELGSKLTPGIPMSTPVFDGAEEDSIQEALDKAQLPVSGQATLFDGRTGEPFHQKVTVGTIYMMKLHHLVDDKIHARSIGPYSLVTQQPLGGKAQFGGQRLGEMEVWSMEAYGAAYSLQEFLTVKSDDVLGRTRMYETIVKGKNILEPGLPESFNVLIKELKSLALDVELLEGNEK